VLDVSPVVVRISEGDAPGRRRLLGSVGGCSAESDAAGVAELGALRCSQSPVVHAERQTLNCWIQIRFSGVKQFAAEIRESTFS